MGKPKKGGVRRRAISVPGDPWPVGSLCYNVKNLEIIEWSGDWRNWGWGKHPLAGFRPELCLRLDDDGSGRTPATRSLVQLPFLYLGLTTLLANSTATGSEWDVQTLQRNGNIELIFLMSWGPRTALVSWIPMFYYDGQVRSLARLKKEISDVFSCVSRFDTSV